MLDESFGRLFLSEKVLKIIIKQKCIANTLVASLRIQHTSPIPKTRLTHTGGNIWDSGGPQALSSASSLCLNRIHLSINSRFMMRENSEPAWMKKTVDITCFICVFIIFK